MSAVRCGVAGEGVRAQKRGGGGVKGRRHCTRCVGKFEYTETRGHVQEQCRAAKGPSRSHAQIDERALFVQLLRPSTMFIPLPQDTMTTIALSRQIWLTVRIRDCLIQDCLNPRLLESTTARTHDCVNPRLLESAIA